MTMLYQIKSALAKFLQWWLAELAALVPGRVQELYRARGLTVTLTLDGTAGEVSIDTAKGREHLFAFDCSRGSVGEVRQTLAKHIRNLPHGRRRNYRWQLRLPAHAALRTTMALPLAAEENLREVIGFEIDRYTPFTAANVYLSHRRLPRDPAANQISAEVVVVPRPLVHRALALADQIGFEPDRVVVGSEADPDQADPLPIEAGAQPRSKLAAAAPVVLGATALVLAAVVIYIPLGKMYARLGEINRRLPEVSRTASEAARLQKEIAAVQADGRLVGDRKNQSTSVTQILAELTHLLPDDTWIIELQISGVELQIQGSSASAPAIIALLEQSKHMKGAVFRAPTTQDPTTGRERFQIATQLISATQK
jgi:general secretion pathway protein L